MTNEINEAGQELEFTSTADGRIRLVVRFGEIQATHVVMTVEEAEAALHELCDMINQLKMQGN